jgi:hypothetical protein
LRNWSNDTNTSRSADEGPFQNSTWKVRAQHLRRSQLDSAHEPQAVLTAGAIADMSRDPLAIRSEGFGTQLRQLTQIRVAKMNWHYECSSC